MRERRLPFLTRRANPDQLPPPAPGRPRGLRLALESDTATNADDAAVLLPEVPAPTRDHVLSDETPAVRLSAISSGIGSLLVGPLSEAAWELRDLRTGTAGGAISAPAPGNRPIVEQSGDHVLVNLRHIRQLRRLVVAGVDTSVQTHGGSRVSNPGSAVTTIGVIDGRIEIRREPHTNDIQAAYTIGVLP